MQSQQTIRRHADLVDRMATAQGHDLEEAILRGKMDITDLENAVLNCTGCAQPDACARFLAAVDRLIDTAPGYCRNRELFEDLSHG